MKKSEVIQYAARLKKLLLSKEPAEVEQGIALLEALEEPAVSDRLLDGIEWSPRGPAPGKCKWLQGAISNAAALQSLLWRLAALAPEGSRDAPLRAQVEEIPSYQAPPARDSGWVTRYPNLHTVNLALKDPQDDSSPVELSLPDKVTTLNLIVAPPYSTEAVGSRLLADLSGLAGHPALKTLVVNRVNSQLLEQIAGLGGLEALSIRLMFTKLDAASLAPLAKLSALKKLRIELFPCTTNARGRGTWGTVSADMRLDLSPLSKMPLEECQIISWGSVQHGDASASASPPPRLSGNVRWLSQTPREWKIGWQETFASLLEVVGSLEKKAGSELGAVWPSIDLAPLGKLGQLKKLALTGPVFGGVSELSGIQALTGLDALALVDLCGLSDLSALAGMSALKDLQLHGIAATALSGVEGCTAVEQVQLSRCGALVDATALADAPMQRARVEKCTALKPKPKGADMSGAKLDAWKKSLARERARLLKAAAKAGASKAAAPKAAASKAKTRAPAKKKKGPSPRTLMRPIAKSLKERSWTEQLSAVDQARELANAEVYQLLLDGVSVDDEGAIVASKRFGGSEQDTSYRTWSMVSLLADSTHDAHAALRDSVRKIVLQCSSQLLPRNRTLPRLPNLAGFSKLEELAVRGWAQADLSALPALAHLHSVDARVSGSNSDLRGGAEVKGLSQVAALPALRSLKLFGANGLGDLAALSGHAGLQSLSLERSDATALPELPALTELNLNDCSQLADISALAASPALEDLALKNNPALTDLSALRDLPRLARVGRVEAYRESTVNLDGLGAPDLSPLMGVLQRAQLGNLSLYRGGVHKLPELGALSGMKSLRLASLPELDSVAGAAGPALVDLQLSELPKLTSLDGMGAAITKLYLYRLALSSLAGVEALSGLTGLRIRSLPGLASIAALAQTTALESLELWKVPALSDLSPLSGLASLRKIDIREASGLTDVSPLGGLPALEELRLRECASISDLSQLAGSTSLQKLFMPRCTSVWDLSPLAGLPALETLDIFNCDKVTDLSVIADFPALKQLHVNRNALRKEVNELAAARPELVIRGEY